MVPGDAMIVRRTVLLTAAWAALVTGAHAALNLDLGLFGGGSAGKRSKFKLGYLPVTCHLTCPVTDYITRNLGGGWLFEPIRFSGWPELKEAFLSRHTLASFILAPMAMALREQGIPIKIVYLGHRDGTAMMVHNASTIRRIEDLAGKRVAVPNRFSNQRLLLFKALRERGMSIRSLTLVEMPPPDMPAALYARSVDAITSGEPFMGQTELDGYGRILYLTKDVWPNFISCVLAVREELLRESPADVQLLVDGIAQSGMWLDQKMDHRMQAASFVSRQYYNQHPRLLAHVLSKPPDRVKYTQLAPLRADFEEIEALGREAGILEGKARFDDYVDDSFAERASRLQPFAWEAPAG
jgi:NitT/TauT family transport system substrate-binding protein